MFQWKRPWHEDHRHYQLREWPSTPSSILTDCTIINGSVSGGRAEKESRGYVSHFRTAKLTQPCWLPQIHLGDAGTIIGVLQTLGSLAVVLSLSRRTISFGYFWLAWLNRLRFSSFMLNLTIIIIVIFTSICIRVTIMDSWMLTWVASSGGRPSPI